MVDEIQLCLVGVASGSKQVVRRVCFEERFMFEVYIWAIF